MAVYAIGDIQGCHEEFQALLAKVAFVPGRDRLWLTGDLVNRGPLSLETLRTLRNLGESAICVLGNHDLHLLAVAEGISKTRHKDTFSDVLEAPDRDELLTWLRHRPLLHQGNGHYLVHAGLPPQWTLDEAMMHAQEVSLALQGDGYVEFLFHMYGDQPDQWSDSLQGWNRLRFIVNCLTRLRYCSLDGRTEFRQKGKPGSQPKTLIPWFRAPSRRNAVPGQRIVFGHWSTLGFHVEDNVICLDTGCLWGGELTALRIDDGSLRRFSVPSKHRKGYQQKS